METQTERLPEPEAAPEGAAGVLPGSETQEKGWTSPLSQTLPQGLTQFLLQVRYLDQPRNPPGGLEVYSVLIG